MQSNEKNKPIEPKNSGNPEETGRLKEHSKEQPEKKVKEKAKEKSKEPFGEEAKEKVKLKSQETPKETSEEIAKESSKEKAEEPAQPYDRGYKKILMNKRVFLHTLRKYTDFAWAKEIREEDIAFEDKEFVTDKFHTYESDLICRIRHGEQEIYLFVLMELQSKVDFTMPFRLLVYMVDIWEKYFRNVPEDVRTREEFRLPMVVPLVLYNGKYHWTALRQFSDYLADGAGYGESAVSFRYALIDVRRLAEDVILNTNTVIDNVFYLDRARERREFLKMVGTIMDRVAKLPSDEKNLMEVWFSNVLGGMFGEKEREFIRECFRRGDKEMISGIEQIIAEDRAEAEARGRAEGEAHGRAEGEKIGEARGRVEGEKIGEARGRAEGTAMEREKGIQGMIKLCVELSQTREFTAQKLLESFSLTMETAQQYINKYWPK